MIFDHCCNNYPSFNQSFYAIIISEAPTTMEKLTTTTTTATGKDFNDLEILSPFQFHNQSFMICNNYFRGTNNDTRSNHNNNHNNR